MSDHFDGRRFFNPGLQINKSFRQLLRWQLLSRKVEWPRQVPNRAEPRLPAEIAPGEVYITLINHATLLVQMRGLNLLTDPVFSDRVSPFQSLGPKRVRPPGLPIEKLPKIHMILVSHNHYDHLDVGALALIAKSHQPRVITPLGNGALIQAQGFAHITEMDWWEDKHFGPVKVSCVPAQHWSGRGLRDRNLALWSGFIVHGEKKVYFAGDTGYGGFFKEIRERTGAPDVALLPIGAYEPRWFMKEQHMNPAEAVEAHLDLSAAYSVGMHYGCFRLTDEGIDEPVQDLAFALRDRGLDPARFRAPETGETLKVF